MTSKLAAFVCRKAGLVVIIMTLLTLIPAYFIYKGLSLTVVLEEMLPIGAKNVELFERFGPQFGGANTTLIEVKNKQGDIYSTEFLEKYKKIADDVFYNPETYRPLSQSLVLRKTKAISGSSGSVDVSAILWPDLPRDEESMQKFRRAVNNQYRGFLVSDDETSAMIIADFKDTANFEQILSFFEGIQAEMEDDTLSIHVVGRPILLGYIYRSLDSVFLILVVSLLIIAVVLYLYFRT